MVQLYNPSRMRWNDAASWLDTLVWTETDSMDVITSASEDVVRSSDPVLDTMGLIDSKVQVSRLEYGGITDTVELTAFIPAKSYLLKVLLINNDVSVSVDVMGGTTASGEEVWANSTVNSATYKTIPIDVYIATESSLHVTLNAEVTGLDIYLLYWKI